MASRFVRKVRTASGAVAVQVVSKTNGVVGIEHVGSAHTDAELRLLLRAAQVRATRAGHLVNPRAALPGRGGRKGRQNSSVQGWADHRRWHR